MGRHSRPRSGAKSAAPPVREWWECECCGLDNHPSQTVCDTCMAPRPDLRAKLEPLLPAMLADRQAAELARVAGARSREPGPLGALMRRALSVLTVTCAGCGERHDLVVRCSAFKCGTCGRQQPVEWPGRRDE